MAAAAPMAVTTLRPRALPSWWKVLIRPEEAPASLPRTPVSPAEVIGAKASPCPMPMSTIGTATSLQ